jgi:hypothetical protein
VSISTDAIICYGFGISEEIFECNNRIKTVELPLLFKWVNEFPVDCPSAKMMSEEV